MRRAFPILQDDTEFTNDRNETYAFAEDTEAEKQGVFSSTQSNSRRTLFLQGSEKPRKEEGEEEEADIQAHWIDDAKKKRMRRPHTLGQSWRNAGNDDIAKDSRALVLPRPSTISSSKTQVSSVSREMTRSHETVQAHQTSQVILKRDANGKEHENLQTLANEAADVSRDIQFRPEVLQASKILESTLDSAASAGHDKELLKSIMLDVFEADNTEGMHQSACSETLASAARLLRIRVHPTKIGTVENIQSSLHGDSEIPDLHLLQDKVTDNVSMKISADVWLALDKAFTGEWKQDANEQERIGTWAVQVLKQSGLGIADVLKREGLQPLGRLVMQLLSSTAASSRNTVHSKQSVNVSRQGASYTPAFEASKEQGNIHSKHDMQQQRATGNVNVQVLPSIADLHDAFKHENFQHDLQAFQNNLVLEESADVLLETFIEKLRNDTLDEVHLDIRKKSLEGQASEDMSVRPRKRDESSSRHVAFTNDMPSFAPTSQRLKRDITSESASKQSSDFVALGSSAQTRDRPSRSQLTKAFSHFQGMQEHDDQLEEY